MFLLFLLKKIIIKNKKWGERDNVKQPHQFQAPHFLWTIRTRTWVKISPHLGSMIVIYVDPIQWTISHC